jgi:hypothetical protein
MEALSTGVIPICEIIHRNSFRGHQKAVTTAGTPDHGELKADGEEHRNQKQTATTPCRSKTTTEDHHKRSATAPGRLLDRRTKGAHYTHFGPSARPLERNPAAT